MLREKKVELNTTYRKHLHKISICWCSHFYFSNFRKHSSSLSLLHQVLIPNRREFPPCLFFPSNTPSGFSVPWAKSNIPEVFAQIPGLYTAHKCQLQAINAAWGAFSRGSRLTRSRDRRDWHVECWQLIFWKVHQHPRLWSCTTCTIWWSDLSLFRRFLNSWGTRVCPNGYKMALDAVGCPGLDFVYPQRSSHSKPGRPQARGPWDWDNFTEKAKAQLVL